MPVLAPRVEAEIRMSKNGARARVEELGTLFMTDEGRETNQGSGKWLRGREMELKIGVNDTRKGGGGYSKR